MKKTIDITVAIPVYNSKETIFRAIESILEQTVQPKKIIIVDDKSTDDTVNNVKQYIEKYQGNIQIQLIELDINSGPAKARNTGWNNSNSKYIAFLDSDDSWHPQKLEIQYNFMKNNPDIKLTGHLMKLCLEKTPNQKNINIEKNIDNTLITDKMLINKNLFTTTSNIIISNDVKLRFNEKMRYSEDYYLWLNICFKYKIALLNYELGYAYKSYTGAGGLTGNINAMYQGSIQISKILLKDKKITYLQYLYRISIRTFKFLVQYAKKNIIKGNS